jgi:hypothetical protein
MSADDELVILSVGPAYDDPQVISLSELPSDAQLTAVEIDAALLIGGTSRMLPVYSVER